MKRGNFLRLLAASPLGFMVPKDGERKVLQLTAGEFAARLKPMQYKEDVTWIHFRLRGSFTADIRNLGYGTENELSQLCVRVTGLRPSEAHRECLEANSILPFMDRCIPYLLRTKEIE